MRKQFYFRGLELISFNCGHGTQQDICYQGEDLQGLFLCKTVKKRYTQWWYYSVLLFYLIDQMYFLPFVHPYPVADPGFNEGGADPIGGTKVRRGDIFGN